MPASFSSENSNDRFKALRARIQKEKRSASKPDAEDDATNAPDATIKFEVHFNETDVDEIIRNLVKFRNVSKLAEALDLACDDNAGTLNDPVREMTIEVPTTTLAKFLRTFAAMRTLGLDSLTIVVRTETQREIAEQFEAAVTNRDDLTVIIEEDELDEAEDDKTDQSIAHEESDRSHYGGPRGGMFPGDMTDYPTI